MGNEFVVFKGGFLKPVVGDKEPSSFSFSIDVNAFSRNMTVFVELLLNAIGLSVYPVTLLSNGSIGVSVGHLNKVAKMLRIVSRSAYLVCCGLLVRR